MERDTLAREIGKVARLKGTFTLRSGKVSNEYFDKYRFEGRPDLLAAIAEHAAPLIPAGTDLLAGLELGGVPIATALSLRTGLHALFVRKKAKEYGTNKLAEGPEFSGKCVCVIEDVITTGGAVSDAIKALRAGGAVVQQIVCVIHRGEAGPVPIEGVPVRPLFLSKEIPSS